MLLFPVSYLQNFLSLCLTNSVVGVESTHTALHKYDLLSGLVSLMPWTFVCFGKQFFPAVSWHFWWISFSISQIYWNNPRAQELNIIMLLQFLLLNHTSAVPNFTNSLNNKNRRYYYIWNCSSLSSILKCSNSKSFY